MEGIFGVGQGAEPRRVGDAHAGGAEGAVIGDGAALAMISAIKARDFMVVENGVLVISVVVAVCNLAVDVLYGVIDPRIRND